MLEGPLVFVDIDTQRDFLEPDGALYVPGSEATLANLARLTDFARRSGIPVLATACAHLPGDPELEEFGPHCMLGTPGQERVPATARSDSLVLTRGARHTGGLPAHLTLHKGQLDLFSHPEADRLVALYNTNHPTFVVYGVATDYCVRVNALGLLDRGCRVAVVVDAIRAIDPASEAEVLSELVRRGALLTLAEVVCGD
jgi:nicotinamidase/pyrazinamidase